jgi:murein L,D-transpeptidase YcbB/YkuD
MALARQIEIVELNLDRWRWMPDDLGAKHLLVNVPDFMLYAREDGRTIFDMRVVVGTPGRQATPVFSGDMKTIVFNPSWHIPESIATGETAPAVADDPGYLERLNIEVLRRSDSGAPRPVDPESVDWNDPEEIAGLSFRQRPGDSNALGDVKFLFPNRHAIYLHDTPGQSHFEKRTRALSHGCVRVAEPAKLAAHVLRGEAGWDDVRVAAAMKGATERRSRSRGRFRCTSCTSLRRWTKAGPYGSRRMSMGTMPASTGGLKPAPPSEGAAGGAGFSRPGVRRAEARPS